MAYSIWSSRILNFRRLVSESACRVGLAVGSGVDFLVWGEVGCSVCCREFATGGGGIKTEGEEVAGALTAITAACTRFECLLTGAGGKNLGEEVATVGRLVGLPVCVGR